MSAWIIIHIFLICKRAKLHQKIQVKVLTCRAPTDSDLLTQTYVFILHTGLHKWFKFQSTGATVIKQQPQVFKVAAWRHAQQKFDILDYTYIKANTIFFQALSEIFQASASAGWKSGTGVSSVTVMATEKKAIKSTANKRSVNRKNMLTQQSNSIRYVKCMSTHMYDTFEHSDQKWYIHSIPTVHQEGGVVIASLGYSVCHHTRVVFAVTPCCPQE